MRLSLIIPAFNEEKRLPECLASVRRAIELCGVEDEVEVIVCDNNSTDRTREVAHAGGAKVVFEPVNQIGRARNAGASIATHEWLLFIDADSFLEPQNLRRVLEMTLRHDVVGGGCEIWLDGAPWWGGVMCQCWNTLSQVAKWAAGSFIFCRREAFQAIGGFGQEFFAAEELDLSRRLKRWGKERGQRFTILPKPYHHSSGRKFQLYTRWETLKLFLACLFTPWRAMKRKASLAYFYDGRR